jgi:hypothetical protein
MAAKRKSAAKATKRHSSAHARARKDRSGLSTSAREKVRLTHQARVADLVRRMASGEVVVSKTYAVETDCTVDEAKKAVTVAKAVRAFQTNDDAYLEKLKAAGDAALDTAWGRPDPTAKLLEPIAKLRGYIKPAGGTTIVFNGKPVVATNVDLVLKAVATGLKKLSNASEAMAVVGAELKAIEGVLAGLESRPKQLPGGAG